MCFFFSLIPATFWLVIAYVVLYLSSRADDSQVEKFGRVLAIWVAVIAALFPIMGLVVTFSDLCPITEIMAKLHEL